MQMERDGLLVACRPAGKRAAEEALQGFDRLDFAHTREEAFALLAQHNYRAILVTLQFDESRPFDLLPPAKASGTPILAVKLLHSKLPEHMIQSAFKAALLMGFDGCIDLQALKRRLGRAAALEEFRRQVLALAEAKA